MPDFSENATLIPLVLILAIGFGSLLFGDFNNRLGGDIVLRRSRDGHFYARLGINGVDIPFVVDTGATHMVLSKADAAKAGIDPDSLVYIGRANTANGQVRTARIRLDEVAFGERIDQRVPATVNGGELTTSLLGMSYLDRFSRIEIERDNLRLVP